MAVSAHSFRCQVTPPTKSFSAPAVTVESLLEPFLKENGFVFLNSVPAFLELPHSCQCVVAVGQRRGGNVLSSEIVTRGAIPGFGSCVDIALTRMDVSRFNIRHPAWNTAYNKGQDTRKRLGICVPDASWLEGDVRLVSRVNDAMTPTSGVSATTTFVLEMIAVPKRKQESPFKVDLVRCSSNNFDNAHYLICDESNGRRSVGPWFLVDLYQRNYSKRLKEAHKVVCLSVYRTERGQTMPSSTVPQHFLATHIVNREKWPQNLQRDLSLPPWCTLRGTEHVARGSAVDTELVLRSPDPIRSPAFSSAPVNLGNPFVAKAEPQEQLPRQETVLCQKRTTTAVPLSTKRRASRRSKYGAQEAFLSSFDDSDLMELIGDSSHSEDDFMDAGSELSPSYSEADFYAMADSTMEDVVPAEDADRGASAHFGSLPQYGIDSVLDVFQVNRTSSPSIPLASRPLRQSPSWDSLVAVPSPSSDDQAWTETDSMDEEPASFSWADRLMSEHSAMSCSAVFLDLEL